MQAPTAEPGGGDAAPTPPAGGLVALDVAYGTQAAAAAAVTFDDWAAADITGSAVLWAPVPAEYVPGAFAARELPLLTGVLAILRDTPRVVVIDGYVTLGPEGRPGLGAHLWAALGRRVAVVGVAKTAFAGTPASTEVRRGASQRPLYVTAIGLDAEEARRAVAAMHGADRRPILLAACDRLARIALGPAGLPE